MTDRDDAANDPDDTSALGTCPACGDPTTKSVLLGPGEAYSNPCGCRVAPESALETDADLESPDVDSE